MKKAMGMLAAAALALGIAGGAMASSFDAANEIAVVSREGGSGTRGAFIELMGIEVKDGEGNRTDRTTDEATIANSTSIVLAIVAGNRYAIGYVSLGSLNDTVKALPVDGVAPSAEAVKDGSYAIARPFNIVARDEQSDAAKDFIAFILSAEGQQVVADNNYIRVAEDAAGYAVSGLTGKITVAGSSSVTPVMEKLKEAYVALNPGVEIEIQMSDSTTGVQNAIDGVADIGMASRTLKDSELEAGLIPTVIAMDGIAMIVNPDNPIDSITSQQIAGIYVGEITEWSALAGRQ